MRLPKQSVLTLVLLSGVGCSNAPEADLHGGQEGSALAREALRTVRAPDAKAFDAAKRAWDQKMKRHNEQLVRDANLPKDKADQVLDVLERAHAARMRMIDVQAPEIPGASKTRSVGQGHSLTNSDATDADPRVIAAKVHAVLGDELFVRYDEAKRTASSRQSL